MYSTFMLSDIKQPLLEENLKEGTQKRDAEDSQGKYDSGKHQGLFIDYQDRFMLMNVNSPIASEVIQLQQNLTN